MTGKSWTALGLVVACVLALGLAFAAADPGYVEEIEQYRSDREERLRAPDGWLTLIGLFWLEQGPNRFGSDPELPIALPADAAPPHAGTLFWDGKAVRLVAGADAEITLDGERVSERTLRDDGEGKPEVLKLNRLSMYVIRRGDRVALRVKDPESPTRRDFEGIEFYPVDPDYRVRARFEAYDPPRPVKVPTVAGTTAEMLIPGRLVFSLGGSSLSLEPLVSEPDETELFLIFKDETSGTETYGAGRYLYATLAEGFALVDFNKAYNPPCAFSRYATCPLPPRGNRLGLSIRAGERRYGDH
jgi:uncharacterized protein (DUF1684 family)